MATFNLEVSYAQLAVFDARLTNPFNDWSDDHINQGFAWRPGSVSFATLETTGTIAVTLTPPGPVSQQGAPPTREILVPFTVPAHGEVEISTISGSVPVQLPKGEYALTFRHGHSADGAMHATLSFDPVTSPVMAEILRADDALRPPDKLVMAAQPA
jgi:hypothetical protein